MSTLNYKNLSLPIIIFLFFLVSCNESGKNSRNVVSDMENRNQTDESGKSRSSDLSYERMTASEIEAFINLWSQVYTTNTFDTYIKMYDPERFTGIKRTHTGIKNTYDYPGWVTNKINEFQKFRPEVFIENMRIASLNKNMKSTVHFMQTWVSNKTHYADMGEKKLILVKKDGEILIQHEELLYSKPLEDYFGD